MKNLFYLFTILSFISCEKATEDSSKDTVKFKNKSMASENNYSHQLPYVSWPDEVSEEDRIIEFTLTDSLLTSNAAWDFYDSRQSDTLSTSIQQYIGWIVLQKKDLIAIARDNPANATYQNALKKNINKLVDSKYTGYCLLYHALINVNDPQYQEEQAVKILEYAQNDTFLNDVEGNDGSPDLLKTVVKENYSYINNFKTLTNQ